MMVVPPGTFQHPIERGELGGPNAVEDPRLHEGRARLVPQHPICLLANFTPLISGPTIICPKFGLSNK